MSAANESIDPKTILAQDYAVPPFLIDMVRMTFELHAESTRVTTQLDIRRNPASESQPQSLVLQGEALTLLGVKIDGENCPDSAWETTENTLTLKDVKSTFCLQTEVEIHPKENRTLSGLYTSGRNLCTQCEAQGFRRITYFLDRPDILSSYQVTLIADKLQYPHLLSNGNLLETGEKSDGRHWAKWEDPFVKPCYLFALVAGQYDVLNDKIETLSGREVQLNLFVELGNLNQSAFAMQALKQAMRWDEKVYQRECDVERYMIAAVSDFNAGAMENKGLNIFNDAAVLANPEQATDQNYATIARVVAHEYFHNWSGNRVSCRDWFQLSLKEGLTVYREQNYAYDTLSAGCERIQDVKIMRTRQFSEDAGPLAHPVRPTSYIAIDNFYTSTVYDKGAEVIRVLATIVGETDFMAGIQLYFDRYDGCSVTIEDFVATIEEVSGHDLTQYRLWYSQAGTPTVTVVCEYDEASKRCTLRCQQMTPPTPGQPQKSPLHIPLRVAFYASSGQCMKVGMGEDVHNSSVHDEHTLQLKAAEQSFEFCEVMEKPVLSLLRGFSAPVKIKAERTPADFTLLACHDNDPIGRWSAVQSLVYQAVSELIQKDQRPDVSDVSDNLVSLFKVLLEDDGLELGLKSECLQLPSEQALLERLLCDINRLGQVRVLIIQRLANDLLDLWLKHYNQNNTHLRYQFNTRCAGKRRMKNMCLGYLQHGAEDDSKRVRHQFDSADNLTDRWGALLAINDSDHPLRQALLDQFHARYGQHKILLDKWFMCQAISRRPDTFNRVQSLLKHPDYDGKNPNSVRALVGGFCGHNTVQFHRPDGKGYAFLAEQVQNVDTFNPSLSARLAIPLTQWRLVDEARQELMKAQLSALQADTSSPQLYEVVSKALRIPADQPVDA